jgi:hypothetical protein
MYPLEKAAEENLTAPSANQIRRSNSPAYQKGWVVSGPSKSVVGDVARAGLIFHLATALGAQPRKSRNGNTGRVLAARGRVLGSSAFKPQKMARFVRGDQSAPEARASESPDCGSAP